MVWKAGERCMHAYIHSYTSIEAETFAESFYNYSGRHLSANICQRLYKHWTRVRGEEWWGTFSLTVFVVSPSTSRGSRASWCLGKHTHTHTPSLYLTLLSHLPLLSSNSLTHVVSSINFLHYCCLPLIKLPLLPLLLPLLILTTPTTSNSPLALSLLLIPISCPF